MDYSDSYLIMWDNNIQITFYSILSILLQALSSKGPIRSASNASPCKKIPLLTTPSYLEFQRTPLGMPLRFLSARGTSWISQPASFSLLPSPFPTLNATYLIGLLLFTHWLRLFWGWLWFLSFLLLYRLHFLWIFLFAVFLWIFFFYLLFLTFFFIVFFRAIRFLWIFRIFFFGLLFLWLLFFAFRIFLLRLLFLRFLLFHIFRVLFFGLWGFFKFFFFGRLLLRLFLFGLLFFGWERIGSRSLGRLRRHISFII